MNLREKTANPQIFALLLLAVAVFFLCIALMVFDPFHVTIGVISIAAFSFLIFYPRFGLYALAFFLPVTSWYFYIGTFEIPLVDIVGLALFSAFVMRSLYFLFFNRQRFAQITLPLFAPFLLFLGIYFLSAAQTSYWAESLWYTVRWIVMFYFVYIFLPVNIIISKRELKGVIVSLILSALVVSAMGLISLTQQDFANEFVRIKPIEIFGIYPIEQNQKHISETILSSLFLLLALPLLQKRPLPKWLLAALFIFLSIIALGSFARTAWIVFSLQLIALTWYLLRTARVRQQSVAIAAVIIALVLLPAAVYMLSVQLSNLGVGSTESRWLLASIGASAFLEHPLLGIGAGQFEPLIEHNLRFMAKYGRFLDAHGVVQKITTETGILGLTAFVVFCVAIALVFARTWQALRAQANLQALMLYFFISAAGIFLFEFFDTFYYKGKLWFIIGLALAVTALVRQGRLTVITPYVR